MQDEIDMVQEDEARAEALDEVVTAALAWVADGAELDLGALGRLATATRELQAVYDRIGEGR
jgi:hypothetical protein